jgi:hypothetical protein
MPILLNAARFQRLRNWAIPKIAFVIKKACAVYYHIHKAGIFFAANQFAGLLRVVF